MGSEKITFRNRDGFLLAAKLEMPDNRPAHHYAIFAHCFTCTKNLNAVRAISGALTDNGFGVLSFDFTGLGDSEGEFAETNFSSNVADLVDAAIFIQKNHQPPSLLVGHSLGGAAVIFASPEIPSVNAVATIGAPSKPGHVKHLLQNSLQDISISGEAIVSIGGRPFKIKKQLLDDLSQHRLSELIRDFKKSFLILHSPQDETVNIENAAELYAAAHHPKSFISLDRADHLLSKKADAIYAGNVIAIWAGRYMEKKTLCRFWSVAIFYTCNH